MKPRDGSRTTLPLPCCGDRGDANAELMVAKLRHLEAPPQNADLVVVDAAHDYENQYADLRLALTAQPAFISVDAIAGEETTRAAKEFLEPDAADRRYSTAANDYIGGRLVIVFD